MMKCSVRKKIHFREYTLLQRILFFTSLPGNVPNVFIRVDGSAWHRARIRFTPGDMKTQYWDTERNSFHVWNGSNPNIQSLCLLSTNIFLSLLTFPFGNCIPVEMLFFFLNLNGTYYKLMSYLIMTCSECSEFLAGG